MCKKHKQIMKFKEWLLSEASFDTVSDFLLNPEHRSKTWNQLIDEFKSSGGEEIGVGKYGTVFSHPNWPYVLKVYEDEYYTRFARFAYKNPHPAFPKFLTPPQRIIPFYRRYASQATKYIVRMEKLLPIPKELFKKFDRWIEIGMKYAEAKHKGTEDYEIEDTVYPPFKERKQGKTPYLAKVKYFQDVIDFIKENPKTYNIFEGLYLLKKENLIEKRNGRLDIHENNFMQRANGDIVIVDPLWGGSISNPYEDYKKSITFDYEPDDSPPNLIGGQLPVKKIKSKQKPKSYNPPYNTSNNMPF